MPLDIHNSTQGTPGNKRGEPNIAVVLTALVPGAGHVYVGSALVGLIVFAIVEGLYFVGLKLSHGMVLQFLDPELRIAVAPALMPEVGNAGALLWQLRTTGFGGTLPQLWPDFIRIGSMLTAASGILNAVAMVHVHMLARTGSLKASMKAALDVLLGWLVPGLGHVAQGRKLRGAIVFVLLVGLFALGTALAEGSNLSRERHFFYWGGQFIVGLPAILGELVWGNVRVDHDIAYVDAGLVFGCVAGLLNVLALIDAYGYREAKLLALPLKSSQHAAPTATATPPPPAGAIAATVASSPQPPVTREVSP